MLQIRTINKIAASSNLRLVKRRNCFQWIGTSMDSATHLMELPTTAVFAERVNDLTLQDWLGELSEVSLKD